MTMFHQAGLANLCLAVAALGSLAARAEPKLVVPSAVAALADFAKNAAGNRTEILGFGAQISSTNSAEFAAWVNQVIDAGRVQKKNYRCSASATQPAAVTCRAEASSDIAEHPVPQGVFAESEYREAAEAALAAFLKIKITGPLKGIKVWRSFESSTREPWLQIKVSSGEKGLHFFSCHKHQGHAIDCHRQRAVGAHEPQD